jgi:uncharacterized membrane protein
LKNTKAERDRLQKTAEDLRRSLKADTEELSKQVAALTAQKQNLDKQLADLRKNIDTQRAAEAADKERMKSTYDQLLASLNKEVGRADHKHHGQDILRQRKGRNQARGGGCAAAGGHDP